MDTLAWLMDVKGNVRSTLDKLKGVKADLVHGNEGWKDWDFKDLLTELKKWTQINPVKEFVTEKSPVGKRNQHFKMPLHAFNTHQSSHSQKEPHAGNQCVNCKDDKHRSTNCAKVSVYEGHKILSEKKLCFNFHQYKALHR